MGGAGLVFDNLGVNMISMVNRASVPSILYLNRNGGEEVEVRIEPVQIQKVWQEGRRGIYALMDYTFERFGEYYSTDPRILAVGPASSVTDFGAVASVPISKGKLGVADTWAGRGGFGSKLLQEHGIAAIIYGGTFITRIFETERWRISGLSINIRRNWRQKIWKRQPNTGFDPDFKTGGTLGVNFATLAGNMVSFNYKSIFMSEQERLDIHDKFILNHYLKQFNEETIVPKKQKPVVSPV